MKKFTANDPETQSADVLAGNIEQLKAMFPEAFTEGKIDFDVLKQLLGGAVEEREEKYGLNWHGKRRARQIALTPSTGTLRPCPEDSVDWDTTQNIMIEGDNLEVLKLLQKSCAGKVKLIYIDPPYNTGKEFVYPDDFQDNIKNYLELTGQVDGEGKKIRSNTESSGRFHTDWLNMMYPRLKLGRNLLRDDGVVLVSCDDNEAHNLKTIMNEVLGEENFVAQIVWQRSKKGDAKLIANVHEYIICYVRDQRTTIEAGLWRRRKEGVNKVLEQYAAFKRKFNSDHEQIRTAMMEWFRGLADMDPCKDHKHYNWSDDRGLYFSADFAGPDDGRESRPRHEIFHPLTGKPCKKPSTGWRWDEEKTKWALAQHPPRIHFGPDETTIPTRKTYLEENSTEPYPSVFYRDGRSATLEVESLVGKGWFQFPKNTEVLADLIELTTGQEDLILDFFGGSGSTGHAVMKLNQAHQSKRRFILVQLPEPTEKKDYPTIADIAKERLRQAGKKIQEENPAFVSDLGFRVFKLDTSNIRAWEPISGNLEEAVQMSMEHLRTERTEADILYELLLKLGLDLCVPIEQKTIAGKTVHSIGAGILVVCLAPKIGRDEVEPLALGIVEWHKHLAPAGESTAVFRDSAFADDVAKTNLTAILQQYGLENVRSL
jgi:adenine-specific DNA-methyltransferase